MAMKKKQTTGKAAAPVVENKAAAGMETVKAEPAKKTAEETEKKTEAAEGTAAVKKTEEKPVEKKTAGKPVGAAKSTVAKAVKKLVPETKDEKKPVKKQEIKTGISVQYMGKDISDKDMVALVKKDWTASKHKISDIKTMDLYVKTEENKVYYVINGTETGSVEI